MKSFHKIATWQNAITDWALERNFVDGATIEGQIKKLKEEVSELEEAIAERSRAKAIDAVGDIVVVVTVICFKLGLSLRYCMASAYHEIKDRKGRMVDGQFVKEVAE
jgi:NTP pyrophosphatase (non-canonical NTP hydrolase)